MAQAPAFSIPAAVSGREVSNATLAGRLAVLVFHGPKTTEAPKEVSKAVRPEFLADRLMVASIVDLRSMAGLWKRVAEATIRQSYEKLAAKAKELDPSSDPADYVLICPDWENAVGKAFGVEQPDQAPTAVLLGKDGSVHARLTGEGLGAQVLAAVRKAAA